MKIPRTLGSRSFIGHYDMPYFNKLNIISETHVKIGLPSHYVHAAFSFVRQFLEQYFTENGYALHMPSIHKIIDINLDILSLAYKEESQQKLLEEVILIKQSIKNNNVIPYVQPIVDAKTGKISKYECLMRLYDEGNDTLHSIYPLLRTAKETLLYEALMAQMLDKTFTIFEKLPYSFSVNLSYDDIVNDSCREQICNHLNAFPDPQRIIFEILETDFIIDFDIVIDFNQQPRPKGTGLLIIAKDIQAETIAEYVHNREVYEVLQTLNVDYLQGYFIQKPFPASKLLER